MRKLCGPHEGPWKAITPTLRARIAGISLEIHFAQVVTGSPYPRFKEGVVARRPGTSLGGLNYPGRRQRGLLTNLLNKEIRMTNPDAGDNAGSNARAPKHADVTSKPPISPAARKLAEYIARRMAPMIESAATKRTQATQQANDAVGVYTQRKGD